ncbi:dihydroxy-acid dehydratase [Natronospirillum operosum]|uniref:Dihydroxy-acid dehydratase n=1 Tax=Natronospirillum operosum TaxID=2759953 RepID=A0A4Z0W880_9GAMM|nr:L-arabinonate dehydratase [Natronospirillum operosum]TGG92947.1 dihydroxy-acid dehydratase [Natronospirillum operosum]
MNSTHRPLDSLRSQRWYDSQDMRGFAHRQRTQQMGLRREEFMHKPVVGIINTWSELSPCHAHLRNRAEAVKRAVWTAGGFPVELPAMSLGEVLVKPTTMLYRNFLAMETEELLRSHPIDGAVLLGGCDKTSPGLLMGAISMNIPAIFCPAGPMLNGKWKGKTLGAGTHTRKYWDELRSGNITQEEWVDLESRMTRSNGTCNTMGTASTMTSIVDAMGLTLPGASSLPAADSAHTRMASACGSRIIEMIWEDLKPSDILTRDSFLNGARTYMALGGSTNAAVHLIALARRANVELTLDDLDAVAREIPVLSNIFPSGEYLMEDFYYAGGLGALLQRLKSKLALNARTVTGRTLEEDIAGAECYNDDVIRPFDKPICAGAALAVLKGNLAPNGAVIKHSAADPKLARHRGKAIVFDNHQDLVDRIDDPALEVTADSVLVLRNAGPKGAPGMPEWGALPIPRKLLAQGVRDMLRISDARMSGTHYGTCVLHVAPESAVGGPLALVRDGDEIELDVDARRLQLCVSDDELARRRADWQAPSPRIDRGYTAIFQEHVTQADQGCDFDILQNGQNQGEPQIF